MSADANRIIGLRGLTPELTCGRIKQSERSEQSLNRQTGAAFRYTAGSRYQPAVLSVKELLGSAVLQFLEDVADIRPCCLLESECNSSEMAIDGASAGRQRVPLPRLQRNSIGICANKMQNNVLVKPIPPIHGRQVNQQLTAITGDAQSDHGSRELYDGVTKDVAVVAARDDARCLIADEGELGDNVALEIGVAQLIAVHWRLSDEGVCCRITLKLSWQTHQIRTRPRNPESG